MALFQACNGGSQSHSWKIKFREKTYICEQKNKGRCWHFQSHERKGEIMYLNQYGFLMLVNSNLWIFYFCFDFVCSMKFFSWVFYSVLFCKIISKEAIHWKVQTKISNFLFTFFIVIDDQTQQSSVTRPCYKQLANSYVRHHTPNCYDVIHDEAPYVQYWRVSMFKQVQHKYVH